MMKATTRKAIVLLMVFLMVAPALLAQYDVIYDTPQQPMAQQVPQQASASQGMLDGQRDAQGNYLYGCGGFACGVFGFIAAVLSNPQPKAATMEQIRAAKGTEYSVAYQAAYSKKAKNQNMLYAGIGWAAGAVVSLIYLSADPAYSKGTK